MGTTKLTKKEILSEDPVRETILNMIEFLRVNRKWIGIGVAAFIVVGLGAFFGIDYLDTREIEACARSFPHLLSVSRRLLW